MQALRLGYSVIITCDNLSKIMDNRTGHDTRIQYLKGMFFMKKLIFCLAAFFILVNVSGAGDPQYYSLKENSLVFFRVTDVAKIFDLVQENIADEYFKELLNNNLATQTFQELIVYKFDKISYKNISYYRIKLKNGGDIKFINTQSKMISTIKMKNDDIIGWVFEMDLKKIKKSK
jgi:hypothetical protein